MPSQPDLAGDKRRYFALGPHDAAKTRALAGSRRRRPLGGDSSQVVLVPTLCSEYRQVAVACCPLSDPMAGLGRICVATLLSWLRKLTRDGRDEEILLKNVNYRCLILAEKQFMLCWVLWADA